MPFSAEERERRKECKDIKELQLSPYGRLLSDICVVQQSIQAKSLIRIGLHKLGAVFSFSFQFFFKCEREQRIYSIIFIVLLVFLHNSRMFFNYAITLKYLSMHIHYFFFS